MIAPESRPVSKFRRKSTFYSLSLISGIIVSVYVILDDYVNKIYISDPYILGAYEMVVGVIVSLVLVALLHIPIRKKLDGKWFYNIGYFFDRNFRRIRFPQGRIGIYTLLAGFFASGSSILYYVLLERNDASVIMPFSQFVLIYLLLGDSISEKQKPVLVELQSMAMIAVGVIIATVSNNITSSSSSSFLVDIFLIIGPLSLCSAFYIFFQKKALTTKDKEGKVYDSINLRIWTMMIITIGHCLAAIPSYRNGGLAVVREYWQPTLFPVILSMLLVFIAVVFYTRALTMGKMSIVRALKSVSVVSTLPMLAIAGIGIPGLVSVDFWSNTNIVLKISGSILILIGVIALALSETRSILLAKVKQGVKISPEELSKLKGVEDFSFITGIYDILINIKIRSIGKTFRLIEKSIAKLSWIEDVTTLLVMKEYE
ncbi:MAG: hypothetical protein HGN29_05310 [Asgard group archaeon]|nr:hypothetical protein [Asgard group archaeon]